MNENIKTNLVKVGLVAGSLLAMAPFAFAVDPTPTITQVDPAAAQLVVNTAGSVTQTFIDMLTLVWPYALKFGLIAFAIAVGIRFFFHKGK